MENTMHFVEFRGKLYIVTGGNLYSSFVYDGEGWRAMRLPASFSSDFMDVNDITP